MNSIRKSLSLTKKFNSISTKVLTTHISKYSTIKDNDKSSKESTNIEHDNTGTIKTEKSSLSGLKNTFDMFDKVSQQEEHTHEKENTQVKDTRSFATLLRESNFIGIGDPNGRIISGKIIEVVDEDLYIDFGGKFHCVCKKPKSRASDYQRGVAVRLRLRDLELASRFLGAEKDITLLEADATLIGLERPNRHSNRL